MGRTARAYSELDEDTQSDSGTDESGTDAKQSSFVSMSEPQLHRSSDAIEQDDVVGDAKGNVVMAPAPAGAPSFALKLPLSRSAPSLHAPPALRLSSSSNSAQSSGSDSFSGQKNRRRKKPPPGLPPTIMAPTEWSHLQHWGGNHQASLTSQALQAEREAERRIEWVQESGLRV